MHHYLHEDVLVYFGGRIFSLATVLLLVLSITAQAATPRVISAVPQLTFSGTTANCTVNVRSGNTSDSIKVTMTLWNRSTEIASWDGSGTGNVFLSKTATAVKGRSYKLTVDMTINGAAQPQAFVTAVC